jgi:hypothetical protein
MTEGKTYDRRAFALTYLEAQPEAELVPYYKVAYKAALRVQRQQVLVGLQELFDLSLDSANPDLITMPFSLFKNTVRSYFAITHPGARYLEAGLTVGQLREAGAPGDAVNEGLGRISDLNDRNRAAHLDVLAALLEIFLNDRATKVFTSADLRAIDVDDTEPKEADHPWTWDDA